MNDKYMVGTYRSAAEQQEAVRVAEENKAQETPQGETDERKA